MLPMAGAGIGSALSRSQSGLAGAAVPPGMNPSDVGLPNKTARYEAIILISICQWDDGRHLIDDDQDQRTQQGEW